MQSFQDHLVRTYPRSNFALQINQPNWKPQTPMQELYLKHVKECKEKFDMTNYNNHNYWMRVAPRRPMMNASFTRLNDGVLPQGPRLLLFATFALPVTLFVDILPFMKGWVKRAHNVFHGSMYHRVVDIPKFSFHNTLTVNRMGVIWVATRFVCRLFQLSREQSFLVCTWACLWLTLPPFYRKARIGIPAAFCGASYGIYKFLEYQGHINVLGIRRGRRSREMFANKTTRFRMRAAEERLIKGNTTGFLGWFFNWHSKNLKDKVYRKKDSTEGDIKGLRRDHNLLSIHRWGSRWYPWAFDLDKKRGFWNFRRGQMNDGRQNVYPEWYYGQHGNQAQADWDRIRPSTRDRAWAAIEHMRNAQGIKFVQPRAYDITKREEQSVDLLNKYLDERFWANPNTPVHGQGAHKFEHYLEMGDFYFF